MSVLRTLFGAGTWGAGGNMVAWVLCGGLGFGWLHAKEKARHLAKLAQAQRHHEELAAQAQAHHEALKAQADVHHEALKAHVTLVAAAQVSGGAGSNPAAAGLAADQPMADAPGAERVVPPPATRKLRKPPAGM